MKVVLFKLVFISIVMGMQSPEDQKNKDLTALKGKWEVISSEFEGQQGKALYRTGTIIVIEENKLYFTDGFAKSASTEYKLDTSSKPKSIDIGSGKGVDKIAKGIYELENGSLKLCLSMAGERPKEFKTKTGDKTCLINLKLQK